MAVLGDRVGDGVVEAPVEGAELGRGDRRHSFESELGDGLAHVAVVVDHLPDGEPDPEQLLAVSGRAVEASKAAAGNLPAKCLGELVQEERDSVFELHLRREGGNGPRGDLRAA